MTRLSAIPLWSLRAACLCAAILLYAWCGSPTPDAPGLPEIMIGILLIAAIGADGIKSIFRNKDSLFWIGAGRALLLYGLSVPMLLGAMHGHDVLLILRDLAPFLFLLLPVFLYPLLCAHPVISRYMTMAVVAGGLLFSLRAIYNMLPWSWLREAFDPHSAELFYFANAPTVLFAALFMIGLAGFQILEAKNLRGFIAPAFLLAFSFVPLVAMVAAAQRASLAAVILYAALLIGVTLWQRPRKSWRIIIVALGAGMVFFPDAAEIFRALTYKTKEVGLNMRSEEAQAVWQQVSASPVSLLFGQGWGGTFYSPATGGTLVNFSHNFFTSILLKAGLSGFLCAILYIGGLLSWLVRLTFREPVKGLALAAPILIDTVFYASFKSLDFGLVLALVPASLLYLRARDATLPVLEKRDEADFWVLYADNRVEICLGHPLSS